MNTPALDFFKLAAVAPIGGGYAAGRQAGMAAGARAASAPPVVGSDVAPWKRKPVNGVSHGFFVGGITPPGQIKIQSFNALAYFAMLG